MLALLIYVYVILVLIGAILKYLFRSAIRCAVILIPIYLIISLISGENYLKKE